MRVLMYGWEFPPRISGGLGVACYAIVKQLAKKNVEVTMVLPFSMPDILGDNKVTLLGCDNVYKNTENADMIGNLLGKVAFLHPGIKTFLSPYLSKNAAQDAVSVATIEELLSALEKINLPIDIKQLVGMIPQSNAPLSGRYGVNLFAEVFRYALVAGSLAGEVAHDVIHAHDWLTVLAGLEAKRRSKRPFIFHVHALETDRSGTWIDKRIFAIEKYGMLKADKVIAVSQYTKNMIIKHYGISEEKIAVVHNGIDLNNNIAEIDTHDRPKMVLFLGRITRQKGPYFFVEIAKKILAVRQDVQFVLAGTGDQMIDMIEKVAGLRVGANVHFTGFLSQAEVKKILALADVYVMPSVSEPFGISCLEALASGVPAVISKQSGVSEVMRHVLIADFWDTDEMANKILALLQYQALPQTLLADAKSELKNLSWEKTATKIINLYNQLSGV